MQLSRCRRQTRKIPKAVVEFYKQVGEATDLPLFAQAVGNMSVAMLIEMYKAVPTFRYVKDEAGQPLFRVGPLREQSSRSAQDLHGRAWQNADRRDAAGLFGYDAGGVRSPTCMRLPGTCGTRVSRKNPWRCSAGSRC